MRYAARVSGRRRPRTAREARETLAGSVYAKPHGWLHQTEDEIEEAYREALRTPVNAP